MEAQFVLIHSPLVGPLSWAPVAEALRRRGHDVLVPTLHDAEETEAPYWQQEVESVAGFLNAEPATHRLLLAGHSGAGALLPAIARSASRSVAAYLFVDAGLPHGGRSRLDEMAANAPTFAGELRAHFATGGRYPAWTDSQLQSLIPDDRLRRELLAELRPRSQTFFEEPLPIVEGWPDAPCGYLLFSPPYARAADQARQAGWPVRALEAGHFHMLVDPRSVADALVDLTSAMDSTAA